VLAKVNENSGRVKVRFRNVGVTAKEDAQVKGLKALNLGVVDYD
jgi:hypothetical protein